MPAELASRRAEFQKGVEIMLELHGDVETGFYWVDPKEDPLRVSSLYDTIDAAQQAREDQAIDWA